MSTKHTDLFAALAAPFEPAEVKSRSQSGRTFRYVTARTVMNRLDAVLGPENWWSEPVNITKDSAVCRLTLRLPDGMEITKCDVGGAAGMTDAGDDDKSIASDALKRAAVLWGVGRYLYRDGTPDFAAAEQPAEAPEPPRRPTRREDLPSQARSPSEPEPERPAPRRQSAARPERVMESPRDEEQEQGRGPRTGGHNGIPRTGRELYPWCCKLEEAGNRGLIKHLTQWGLALEDPFPGRLTDYNHKETKAAVEEFYAWSGTEAPEPASNGYQNGNGRN